MIIIQVVNTVSLNVKLRVGNTSCSEAQEHAYIIGHVMKVCDKGIGTAPPPPPPKKNLPNSDRISALFVSLSLSLCSGLIHER